MNKEHYEIIINNISDGVIVTDGSGLVEFLNPAAGDITGWSMEEASGVPIEEVFQIINKKTFRSVEDFIISVPDEKNPMGSCNNILLKAHDDTERFINCKVTPVYDGKSNRTGVVIVFHEKKEEDRLSEAKYRILTESIKDVVWILDTHTMKFLYVSPSVEKLRGYSPEEILAVPVDDSLMPQYAIYLRNLIKQRVSDFLAGHEEFYTDEVEQPCKDGTTVWTEVITSFYMNERTGHIEVRGVTRDITERKASEKALNEKERVLSTLISNLPGFIYRCTNDQDWTMEYISEGCRAVTGYGPEDFIGNKTLCFNDIVHSDFREPLGKNGRNYYQKSFPLKKNILLLPEAEKPAGSGSVDRAFSLKMITCFFWKGL